MAGPTLGRIIQSEIGNDFVSANLPMLHTRTVENTGQSEFRAGVYADDSHIDLSDEFARQYYGDVMLFTIETLSAQGYPDLLLPAEDIRKKIEKVESELYIQYMSKQQLIIRNHGELKKLFSDKTKWWNKVTTNNSTIKLFTRFIDNIERNFGKQSAGYTLISSTQHKEEKLEQILHAILNYVSEKELWQSIIK